MKSFLFAGLLLLFSASCTTKETTSASSATQAAGAENAVSESIAGTWKGLLPCADCPGIAYTLVLNPDSTYLEEMLYQERSAAPFVTKGKWQISLDGILTLDKSEGAGIVKFELENDALVMLDGEGKRVESDLAAMYRLKKVNREQAESNPQVWQEKLSRGIDFVAMGNEPSWSLEIDLEKEMAFKAPDAGNASINTPVPAPAQGEASITYDAETGAGHLLVQIVRDTCTDNMSGRKFPYTVTVKMNDKEYSGCGMYLSDYRLNDIWALQQLNGKEVKAEDYPREVPTLEFNLKESRVYGSGGCNRVFGGVEVKGDKVSFLQVASTQMACPNMQLEDQFMKAFADKTLTYKIKEGRLTLLDGDKPVLVFKKVD